MAQPQDVAVVVARLAQLTDKIALLVEKIDQTNSLLRKQTTTAGIRSPYEVPEGHFVHLSHTGRFLPSHDLLEWARRSLEVHYLQFHNHTVCDVQYYENDTFIIVGNELFDLLVPIPTFLPPETADKIGWSQPLVPAKVVKEIIRWQKHWRGLHIKKSFDEEVRERLNAIREKLNAIVANETSRWDWTTPLATWLPTVRQGRDSGFNVRLFEIAQDSKGTVSTQNQLLKPMLAQESEAWRAWSGNIWIYNFSKEIIPSAAIPHLLAVLSTQQLRFPTGDCPELLGFFARSTLRYSPFLRSVLQIPMDTFEAHREDVPGGNSTCSMLLGIRYFRSAKSAWWARRSRLQYGYRFRRSRGQFPALPSGEPLGAFTETAFSISCSISSRIDVPGTLPSFQIVILTDETDEEGGGSSSKCWNYDKPIDGQDAKECGMVIRGFGAGIHAFQVIIYKSLQAWELAWSDSISWLDLIISVEAEDTNDDGSLQDAMFDDSFRRSKVYFQCLQILGIFKKAVPTHRKALSEVGSSFLDPVKARDILLGLPGIRFDDAFLAQELQDIRANWNVVSKFYSESEDLLLDRIAAKIEEIQSLRDGLFNATSLREASHSTKMSRYVIIFTIATVIYLPPTFVATVYGTQLFNSDTVSDTVSSFKITTVTLSIGTYFISLLLLWVADRLDIIRFSFNGLRILFSNTSSLHQREKTE